MFLICSADTIWTHLMVSGTLFILLLTIQFFALKTINHIKYFICLLPPTIYISYQFNTLNSTNNGKNLWSVYQFSASSSIIIIEDYYLQTFLHSLEMKYTCLRIFQKTDCNHDYYNTNRKCSYNTNRLQITH